MLIRRNFRGVVPILALFSLGLAGCGANKDLDSGTIGSNRIRGGGEFSSPETRQPSAPGVQGASTKMGRGTGSATGGANDAVGQGSVGTPDHQSY
jgi:hypothetical protein